MNENCLQQSTDERRPGEYFKKTIRKVNRKTNFKPFLCSEFILDFSRNCLFRKINNDFNFEYNYRNKILPKVCKCVLKKKYVIILFYGKLTKYTERT